MTLLISFSCSLPIHFPDIILAFLFVFKHRRHLLDLFLHLGWDSPPLDNSIKPFKSLLKLHLLSKTYPKILFPSLTLQPGLLPHSQACFLFYSLLFLPYHLQIHCALYLITLFIIHQLFLITESYTRGGSFCGCLLSHDISQADRIVPST